MVTRLRDVRMPAKTFQDLAPHIAVVRVRDCPVRCVVATFDDEAAAERAAMMAMLATEDPDEVYFVS